MLTIHISYPVLKHSQQKKGCLINFEGLSCHVEVLSFYVKVQVVKTLSICQHLGGKVLYIYTRYPSAVVIPTKGLKNLISFEKLSCHVKKVWRLLRFETKWSCKSSK